jgi:hypothetical protein
MLDSRKAVLSLPYPAFTISILGSRFSARSRRHPPPPTETISWTKQSGGDHSVDMLVLLGGLSVNGERTATCAAIVLNNIRFLCH